MFCCCCLVCFEVVGCIFGLLLVLNFLFLFYGFLALGLRVRLLDFTVLYFGLILFNFDTCVDFGC